MNKVFPQRGFICVVLPTCWLLLVLLNSCRKEDEQYVTSEKRLVVVSDISDSFLEKGKSLKPFHSVYPLMGTTFRVVCYAESDEQAKRACDLAFDQAKVVERVCSNYDAESELSRLMAEGYQNSLSSTLKSVLDTALKVAAQTKGAYDPTLGYYSSMWRESRVSGLLPNTQDLQRGKLLTGYQKIILKKNHVEVSTPNLQIDFGGIGKGYAADKMLEALKSQGVTSAIVVAGGDVRVGDPPPDKQGWEVQVLSLAQERRGALRGRPLPKVLLRNCAISTSGDIHQFVAIEGKRYSHLVDPVTGLGLSKRISATVIAPTATESDPLATAFCVRPELLETLFQNSEEISWMLVRKSSEVGVTQSQSENFPTLRIQINKP